MLSFGVLTALSVGIELFVFFICCVILIKLPVAKLARLCNALFGFKRVPSDTEQTILINVCGDRYELSTKLSTRIPLALTFSMCFMVVAVVFIDGCVFSGRYLFPNQLCLDQFPYCYIFQSRFSLYQASAQLVCQPDEPVINSSTSANRAMCFGLLLSSQSTVDVLNQLGVCSGILAIIKVLYPLAYRFGRRHAGAICLIGLICGIIIAQIVLIAMQYSISFVSHILLNLMSFLLDTIIYIHWKRRRRRKSRLPKSIADLNKF